MKIAVINGPNINMLGIREPQIYGTVTYEQLCRDIEAHAKKTGIETEIFQSNHEGDIVDKIQELYGRADGIVINPGGYTHTSIAIPDAVRAVGIPTVEVHISAVDEREPYRRINYIREACAGSISGKGCAGYIEAMDFLIERIKNEK